MDNGATAVAVDNEPMVLGDQRRAYRRPKPRATFTRHDCIEAAHGRQCPTLRFPLTPHARDVVANLIVACVVAHADKLPPITTVAGVPITTVEVAGVAIVIAGVATVVVAVATVIVIAIATVVATTVGSPIIVSLLQLRLVCFRSLALPRHRRSRQVQCQPQRVPPECIVSFLHTPDALLNIARLRGTALMQVNAKRDGAMTKPLRVFIRKQGNHFRVVYRRYYANDVLEEVVLTQRFETEADAQNCADAGLRAQRIYRALTEHRSLKSHPG